MYPFKINIKRAISEKPLRKAYIIMYIENQASRHSPPPSLCTIRQPIAVWGALSASLLWFGIYSGWRGGDPSRHRSRDTRQIGEEMRALSLLGPMPRLDRKYTWITHLFSILTWQAHVRHEDRFLLIALNINFKGVHMKLKIVALTIPLG